MLYKTYIIIVTYNATPWLDKCLGSIDFSKYKVVIVDNYSKDETLRTIEKQYPKVELFKESSNLGFGQANNIGISYALNQGAEHVFLLNQDAYLVGDAIGKLVTFQLSNPEYGILSPIHTNATMTKLDRNFSNYVRFDRNSNFYSDHVLENELKPVYEVPFVNAAGWLLSKNCLLRVGGFDPLFFQYGEDDNYCQRVLYHGFKIGVMPKIFMIHDRENREKPSIETYSKEFFKTNKRKLIIKCANVSSDGTSELIREKAKIKKQILKFKLKGQFTLAKSLGEYLKTIEIITQDIQQSYLQNKIPKPHYLNLE